MNSDIYLAECHINVYLDFLFFFTFQADDLTEEQIAGKCSMYFIVKDVYL